MRGVPLRYLFLTARPIAEDLAGTLAFYVLFLCTGSARLAAAVGVALGLAQIAGHFARRRRPPVLLLVGVSLTALLGGMTIVTADPRFVLLKPSIVYGAVGVTMLQRGWVRRYVPPIALALLSARTLDRVGWGWAALLLGSAFVNLALVASLPPLAAATALLIGGLAAKLLLFIGKYTMLSRRARDAAIEGAP